MAIAGAAGLVPLVSAAASALADDNITPSPTGTATPEPAVSATPTPSPSPIATPTVTPTPPPVYRMVVAGVVSEGPPPPPPPPPPDPRFEVPFTFYQGDRERNAVFITMDDCWSVAEVTRAMDIAEAGGARMTFFPVGAAVQLQPSFWKSVVARGHAVEDHTWDHPRMSRLSTEQMSAQISSQAEAVSNAIGDNYRPVFFRPPFGDGVFNYDSRLTLAVANAGMKIAMWSADSNGWKVDPRVDRAAVDFALGNVFANFYPGSIVLLHALPVDNLALPAIIAEANRLNWKCLTLREAVV